MSAPAITVRGVSKRYGRVVAVDNVTLDVQPGEVYAILGLNGAGKTTLIRMILGMVRATSGDVEFTKRRVTDRAVWAQVGYLVEGPSAYPELTVRENLEVVRRLRKVHKLSAVDDAVDLFGCVLTPIVAPGRSRWATFSGSGWPRPFFTDRRCSFSTSRSTASTPPG